MKRQPVRTQLRQPLNHMHHIQRRHASDHQTDPCRYNQPSTDQTRTCHYGMGWVVIDCPSSRFRRSAPSIGFARGSQEMPRRSCSREGAEETSAPSLPQLIGRGGRLRPLHASSTVSPRSSAFPPSLAGGPASRASTAAISTPAVMMSLAAGADAHQPEAVDDHGDHQASEQRVQRPPLPPNRLAPPITAAATAYRTIVPPSMSVEIDPRSRLVDHAAQAGRASADREAEVRTSATLMPARRTASGLAPIA